MAIRFTDLNCKEVICVSDGRRLGYVTDAEIEMPEGNILALIVPGAGKMYGLMGRGDEYVIPWQAVKRVGPDIILVDVQPESCRVPRQRPGLPLKNGCSCGKKWG